MLKKMTKKAQGAHAEQAAIQYLLKKGLKLVTTNYHCKFGEIDIIMQEDKKLIFVEVRQKHKTRFGNAASTITPRKQKNIHLTAQCYLHQYQITHKASCRFDVIAIDGDWQNTDNFSWIKQAF